MSKWEIREDPKSREGCPLVITGDGKVQGRFPERRLAEANLVHLVKKSDQVISGHNPSAK